MPKGYVCSQCRKPISPAQNRCPHCGADIDWQKAVGRITYLDYIPPNQRQRRRKRLLRLGEMILLVGLLLLILSGWRQGWIQTQWRDFVGSQAFSALQQGIISLQEGDWGQARQYFDQLIATEDDKPYNPTPLAMPTPDLVSSTTPSPPPPTPTLASPLPTPTTPSTNPPPTPENILSLVENLTHQAEKLAAEDPCLAAAVLDRALAQADTPEIDARRRSMKEQCSYAHSIIATPSSPYDILYTTFEPALNTYAIREWEMGAQSPGPLTIAMAMEPATRSDGVIAFHNLITGTEGIFLRWQNGVIEQVTQGADDRHPRWSPDGTQLLFTSAQRSPDQTPHLYLVDIQLGAVEDLGPGQNADWSREGLIVFHGCDKGGGYCGLRMLDAITLQRRQISANPADNFPSWSPDGRYIAFMSSGRSESWDVYMMDVATGNITPISVHPAEDGLPEWSPDGRSLAWLSDRDGDWALYTWEFDTQRVQRRFSVGKRLPNWQQAGFDWRE